jgi:hypothetical protein
MDEEQEEPQGLEISAALPGEEPVNETQAIALFRRQYSGGFWQKLHGGRYQSNLPDILWIKDGITRFLEFKIVDGDVLPWAKCRLGQHLTMRKMLSEGATVGYVVYSCRQKGFFWVSPLRVVEGESTILLTPYPKTE